MESHDVELIYELSPIQQAMLFHGLYQPGSGVYVLQQSLRLTGRLDLPAFERAWQHVVDRHAILRTAFFWEGLDKPVQVVYRQVRLEVTRVSWRGVPAEEQQARLARHLEADREQGFDVAAAPLMRVALFELDEDVHQLVWAQHHLVVDGWSQGQVLRELFAGYAAFASGREPRLEPARGYRDYISWLQQQDLAPAEALWRKNLAGLSSPTRIAAGRGRAEAPHARQARRRDLALPAATVAALREMARRHLVTLNTLMQGAWALALSRLTSGATGSAEVVFGATVAGRPPSLPGVESIVGPFLNTLPVRVAVRPEQRLREWLGELQERQVEMRRFEHSPLVDVQRWSGLPAGTPLFDHILVFENVALPAEAARPLPDLAIVEEEARALTNYALDVVVVPGADSLTLSIRYDAGHFASVEIARLLDRLGQVLAMMAAVAAAPEDARLEELVRLSAAEQHQVIVEWGGTPGETPEATLHGRFMAQAARTPEAAAVTCEGVILTYAGLDRRSNRLARHLRSLGVGVDGRECLVGLCCERSPELIEGILGILKAGGAYVPLDPRYPRERLAFLMEDAGIGIVVGTRAAVEGLGSARTVLLDAHRPLLDALPAAPVPERAGGASLAYVIYTSGSTGRPKGVPVSHGNVVRLFDATQGWLDAGPRDVWTLFHSFAFDFSVWEIWGALLHGGRLVVVPWEISRSPPQFLALLAAEGVTVLNQTPSAFAQLAAADADHGSTPNRLRVVIFGGEALDVASLAPWFDRHGDATPRLVNMYGITETTVHVTVRPLRADDATGSIGSPLPDLGLYLLDRRQQPVPIGAAGELVVGGAGLARGYLGHPELAAERFVPDGLSGRPGARLYRSGDLGRFLPTGELEFLGRIDHQVKIRGFRIELGEIETVLAKHPGVRECAVLAARTGETARLVAFGVLSQQGEPSLQEMRAWLQKDLPDHMLPAAFVWLPALPLTANGKVDRKALLALPDAVSTVRTADDGFVTPRTPAEELVANIFAEVLQLDTVGADADFFALGGHSLLATQMASRVRQALGVDMPLRLLFEEPTVAGLATRLQSALVSGDSTLPAWTAIPRRAGTETGEPPLSFAQERLWFLDQLTPGNPIYNIPGALVLDGDLDAAALARALAEVVRRQEVLRTVFRAPGGQPVQVVLPVSPVSLPLIDLSALPEAARTAEAARLQEDEALRGFDLAAGPLFRACLLRLAMVGETTRHLLLLTFHHIAFDGWSIRVLARELAGCYGGSPLPELPIQYADFAAWQRAWLSGETLERFVGYWRRHLSGVPALRLPLDRPRPRLQGFVGLSQPLALTAEMADGVRRLARRQAVTPFMVGLAVFAALLHRSSGQDDFAVGTWVANRNRPELEGLIGYFVNNLALRLDLAAPSTFDELLASVRETALGAYAHQDLPFEKLIEDLKLPRDLSLPAVFQVVCVQQPAAGRLELAGVGLELQAAAGARAHVDLSLDLGDPATSPYTGSLIYNHELFDRTTIARFGGHFERLLAAALATDSVPLAELPLLSPTEAWQLRGEWSLGPIRTDARLRGARFVHQLIERHAAERPEAEAVAWPGGERVTYGELNERANRLARRLRRSGVGPETRVAIWLPRSVEAVVCVLAVLKTGGCYLPLDAAYSGERLAFMVADARARVVLTRADIEGTAGAGGGVLRLDDPETAAALAAESAADLSPDEVGLAPENLAYIIYTSGSTGRPKGTMIAHRGLLDAYAAWEQAYRLGETTAHLQVASFSFDVFTEDLLRALGSGALLVLCPREDLLDPARLVELMRAERIDAAEFVPAVARTLAESLEKTGGRLDFMRLLVVGADALYATEAAALARLCGPRTRLVNSYGVTEVTIDNTFLPLAAGDGTPFQPVPLAAAMVPIGRPLSGQEAWVLGEGFDLAPLRAPGELCLGGTGLARGYLDRPELTAEKFIPHPFATVPGARLYRTGDLARRLSDGSLEFLGRADSQIKIRGFRIEPGEIEAALGAHPGIKQTVVLALDAPQGKQLVAYLSFQSLLNPKVGEGLAPSPTLGTMPAAQPPDDSDLRAFLKQRLPDYMVPAVFVPLAELPLTPNGKIDRRALPIPDWSRAAGREARQPPGTPGEEMLAAIWREVLGVAEIDARDDFFALGGHSLLATRMVARLRAAAGVELPLRSLFVHPVLAELAREVDALRRAGGTAFPPVTRITRITRIPRGATAPLSFAQERLWFLYRFAPQSNAYNIPLTLRLDGGLRPEVAARALGEIVRRHEVLRSVIREAGDGEDGPVQVIQAAEPIDLPLFDLSALPDERREPEMRRLLAAETGRPFDLAQGPVLRALLVRLGERRHAAAITLHHIATDGWSTGILVHELCALYRAFALGGPSPLAELAVQYADYAVWQRRWLSGPALDELLAWWRGRLGADPPPLELPADRPRSRDRAWGGATTRFTLDPALAGRLNRFSRERSVSLFMTLLAGWKVLLARLSGQAVITVGTPVAHRPGVEVEELIGFFLNTLVLATEVSGAPSFAELLERVRETSLEAHAHQDAPFDRLVEDLVGERDLSVSPLFQVIFVLQNVPGATADLPDLRLTWIPAAARAANFDLALMMDEGPAGLSAQLDYSTDLFDATTVERLAHCFQTVLAAAMDAPEAKTADLPLLTPAEFHQLLREHNDTAGGAGADTLPALFEAQARRTPGAPAVLCDGQALTFGDLNARANRLAHFLRGLGVEPEVGIGLCAGRSLDLAIGLLGILKSGGAYVPLDPKYPRERLAFLLADAGVQVVLGTAHALAQMPVPADGIAISLDVSDGPNAVDAAEIASCPESDPPAAVDPANIAYVLYTSGSTGRPKGVMVTHGSVAAYTRWSAAAYRVAEHAGSCVHTPLSFDLTVTSLLTPLLAGRPVQLLPEGADLDGLAQAVATTGFGFVKLTPAHLDLLRDVAGSFTAADPLTLVVGGEALHGAALRGWPERARVFNEYGPTEATVGCAIHAVEPGQAEGAVPIGRPITDARLYVLDAGPHPLPLGIAGELWIGGAGLARGYLGRPDLTAERFLPDACSGTPGARLYRTGDRARRRADGELEFLGRLDAQVKIRGFRIEPGEVEAALAACPGVERAAVLVKDARLIGFVVGPQDLDPLLASLRERLPEHMIPAVVVPLAALPLTANGKVDRKALLSVDDPGSAPLPESRFVAPRNATEMLLAEVWAQVLGRDGGRIGVHDSFFQLGGDSIQSLQVVSRAARAGLRITPRQLFEHPTIAELAAVAVPVEAPRRETGSEDGPAPLTPIQERFFAAGLPHAEHHNQALLLAPASALAPDRLRRAIAHLCAHHDALRLRFVSGPPRRSQIRGETPPPLLQIDLSALPERGRLRALEACGGELQACLDLGRGPLLRAALFTGGGPDQDRLLLILHHLVVDGVSWRILVQDLEAAYGQLAGGEAVELPPKTTSFLRWARLLHDYAASPAAAAQAGWWLEALEPAKTLRLPVDDPAGANTVGSTQGVTVSFTVDETRDLLEEAPRAYRTQVNDLLLTALVEAFAPWTGSRRLLVDLEGHGREELEIAATDVDLSRTVGWLTSLFPVLLDLTAVPPLGVALKVVKETLRSVPGRGIAFGVVRWLGHGETAELAGRLAALPSPEVAFNYLGQLTVGGTDARLFRLAGEPAGAVRHPRQPRSSLLAVDGGVSDGRLWMRFGYSSGRHRRETIERLAERFAAALRALVAHCLAPGVHGFTPSDFPLAALDAAALDRLAGTVEDVYPLSAIQQGMLFHALHAPGSGAYVVQMSVGFGERFDSAAFERAWQQVADRHPVLRTAFVWQGLDEPLQVVHAGSPLTWERHDWRGLPAAGQAERLEAYLRADRDRGFDLSQPPLMRLALLRMDGSHRFVWTHHHAILDGWSLQILLRELFTCYAAERQGATSARLPPVRPFRDHIAWLLRQDLAAAEAFWHAELAGFTAPTPLGGTTAGGAEAAEEDTLHVRRAVLPAVASDALRAFARRHQLTLNTLAQGAWALLLARASDEDDVVFGAVTAGRGAPLPGIDSMVGLFVNTLPVRAKVPHRTSAVPWLVRLQETQVAARHFEHTPLPKVRAWSELSAGAPLFESILGFENYPLDEALREDVGATAVVAGVEGFEQTHYPLAANVQPGSRWTLQLAASPSRLDAVSLARLLGHLENLLLGLIGEETAELPVAELPLLAPAERQQLLIELTGDQAGLAAPADLVGLFTQRARRSPWQVAVVCRGVPLTYAELDQRSASLEGYLRRMGVGPEVRVGLAAEKSLERVVGLLGILRAGGAVVPVDPTALGAEGSRRALAEAKVALLLTVQQWRSGFESPETIVCLDRDWPLITAERARAGRLTDRGEPESLAVISTASKRPGLMISRQAIAAPLPSGLLDSATVETLDSLRNGARPQTHAFVLDRRHQPVPAGTAGDLYLAGPGLARGLLDRPDLTAEQFVPHPWSSEPGGRLYRTGDRARRGADGTIEILSLTGSGSGRYT